ncbi:MAG: laminin B domain-containing protein [Bacteroidota bacterium]
MSKHYLLFLLFLFAGLIPASAQTSTFDTDNENWGASGDPTNPLAFWINAGGNPGGFIRVTDATLGGTWYFDAPLKFRGSKCDAYGKYLRYDEMTSDTSGQQQFGGSPDVVLVGGGFTLVFDNAYNPGLEWTHYDIQLLETAGWRLNSISGSVPTQAEFQAALSNITALRIRGEYRAKADFGGLDNVILESDFRFDLDGDDSSGALYGDFKSDTLCFPGGGVVDEDAILVSDVNIDSIRVRLLAPKGQEDMILDALPPGIQVRTTAQGWITLVNYGSATAADFLTALKLVSFSDALPGTGGTRTVEIRVYGSCGVLGSQFATLPIFPKPFAGMDGDTSLCAGARAVDLANVLGNAAQTGGIWKPQLISGTGMFDPDRDKPGLYTYIIPNGTVCPADTALVEVMVTPAFVLPADTTLCDNLPFTLNVPAGLTDWVWSNGSRQTQITVTEPGIYALSGHRGECVFEDSLRVDYYTCQECKYFVPNIFSPDDDGENDRFGVFFPCHWFQFRLEIFDRWGNLVFAADKPESNWDGQFRGKPVGAGVYAWRLSWEGELLGARKQYRQSGDVTVWKIK